ncbi:glucuronate isomerase, partial [Burkholderia multivorans]|uniref:glucuronate isomerase n=1 Tax=Burkholderia multivorans TaxID=87883 RepID=UPI001E52C299
EGFATQLMFTVIPKAHPGDLDLIHAFINHTLDAGVQGRMAADVLNGPVNSKAVIPAESRAFVPSPQQIAENYRFKNLYDIWLKGDHYKWRAMRTNGVAERLCTGDASDREKFDAWAATVPHTIGNPLYHWTYLELRRPFGITGKVLSPATADEIWNQCNDLLAQDSFSARGI